MANPFSKGWKYLQASLDQSIDENADPQIQIRQAVEGAKKQHQQISQQAAAVIGNKNQPAKPSPLLTRQTPREMP